MALSPLLQLADAGGANVRSQGNISLELLSVPANKRVAYLTDLEGNNIFEFMFAPNELEFTEENEFNERIMVGRVEPDVLWVSGKSKEFNLDIFVDRTAESYGSNKNLDMFQRTWIDGLSMFNPTLVQQMRTVVSKFKSTKDTGLDKFQRSDLNIAPHYVQDEAKNKTSGVLPDLDKLLYFVRQKGAPSSTITVTSINSRGDVSSSIALDNPAKAKKFIAPPKCRFFYGAIWREGYVKRIRYKFTAPNAQLIPQRLEVSITFLWMRGGVLAETNAPAFTEKLGDSGQFVANNTA
jgi:hypothetical protein